MSIAPTDGEFTPSPPAPNPTGVAPRGRARRRLIIVVGAVVLVGAVGLIGQHVWAENRHAAAQRALEQRNFAEARAQLERCQLVRDDEDDLLLAIQIARRSGARPEVNDHIRTYLQKYPKGPAIEREMRLFQMQQGNYRDIDSALSRALASGDGADPWELEAALVGAVNFLVAAAMRGETAPDGPAAPLLKKARGGADLWLRLRPGGPDQIEGLVWRGVCRAITADDAGAIADLRAALERNPDHRDARLHLAVTLRAMAPAEALAHLQLLARRDPTDTRVKGVLGTLYRSMGRFDEARQIFDEFLAIDPQNVTVLMERGGLELDLGRPDRAEPWLTKAQQNAPDDPRTNFALASCLRAAGREDEAKKFNDQYLRIQNAHAKRPDPGAPPPKEQKP
jgi:tetratricopeptide (TPR) repeat protein